MIYLIKQMLMTVDFINCRIVNFKYLNLFSKNQNLNPNTLSIEFHSYMPRLKKTTPQDKSESSQIIAKYLNLQSNQTQYSPLIADPHRSNEYSNLIGEPVHWNDSQQKSLQKRKASGKKRKHSSKKEQIQKSEKSFELQKQARRKSKSKKLNISKQNFNLQNQSDNKSQKIRRGSQKNKIKPQNIHQSQLQENQFLNKYISKDNQLRQKDYQNDQIQFHSGTYDQKLSQEDINFNKRSKQKTQPQKQNLQDILSRYAQDESLNFGNKSQSDENSKSQFFQSDLRDLQMLENKKQKKQKKEKQVKIKNKYFSDLCFQPQSTSIDYEGQQPPQNSQELIIQKKQPRQTINNLKAIISKRVDHLKDRRQLKSSEGDLKIKNHLKFKLQQVKDAEEIELNIQVPNFFTKKSASAALYIKNTIDIEQRNANKNQFNKNMPKNSSNKTFSSQSLNKSEEVMKSQKQKKQRFQPQYKKKGVKRQEFFGHLTKEIKTKKQANIYSEEMKQYFRTSSLDQENFDVDLAEDALSNCCSRSSESGNKQIRKRSADSQHSRKSTTINRQKKNNYESNIIFPQSNTFKETSCELSSQNGQNGQKIAQSSNSKFINTEKSSKYLLELQNPSISEIKQSDISSSRQGDLRSGQGDLSSRLDDLSKRQAFNQINFISDISHSNIQTNIPKFDDVSIKNEVKKSFHETYEIFDSEIQFNQKNLLLNDQNQNQSSRNLAYEFQQRKQSDSKLHEKIKRIIKSKKSTKIQPKQQKKHSINYTDNLLKQTLDRNESSIQNKYKNNKKEKYQNKRKIKKNSKPKDFNFNEYESYFQVEAEYSSSEQGHTDSQNSLIQSDIDEQGDIIGLIDKGVGNHCLNQRLVRKKFLEDQQKRDDEIIQRIMKGLYGKRKTQETESEKKLKKRMEQAAKRNSLKDQQQKNGQIVQSKNQENNVDEKKVQIQSIDNEREKQKLQELENQLHGGLKRQKQNEQMKSLDFQKNQILNLFAMIPSMDKNQNISHKTSQVNNKRVITYEKPKESRKSIFDTKKSDVQQQIYFKRISFDKKKDESIQKRNKLHKNTTFDLDIRNTNLNFDKDLQI